MSERRVRGAALLAVALGAALAACPGGRRLEGDNSVRNAGTLSALTARERPGGENEGPLGFWAPVSRSYLYAELASQGIQAERLGSLRDLAQRDRPTLMKVMNTFTRALGVRCNWCHVEGDFAAMTPRKAVAQYMWEQFVSKLTLRDGSPLYCDSCHHASTIFLHRSVPEKPRLLAYMQNEYVEQLRRRDGAEHGCGTCHGRPVNPRFLPRLSVPEGYRPPQAAPGPAQ